MAGMNRSSEQSSTAFRMPSLRALSRVLGFAALSGALAIAGPARKALASVSDGAPQDIAFPRTIVRSSAPPRGTGLIIGGSAVVTLIGLPSLGIGLLFNGMRRSMDSRDDDFPQSESMEELDRDMDRNFRGVVAYFVISGIIGIAGGATMIGFGVRRYSRFRDWKARNQGFLTRHRLTPVFSTTTNRSTATYGFSGRF